jgi:RNA-directed DNA polymerase
MEKHHPEKPFERYADDILVHCKTEKQALYVLAMIRQRMTACKLTLHPTKTKIVNLRGTSEKKYVRSVDFLGFSLRPLWSKTKKGNMLMVSSFISTKSRQRVMQKFKSLAIHKCRKPIEEIAVKLRPVIQGVINYYCKFWTSHTHALWYAVNMRGCCTTQERSDRRILRAFTLSYLPGIFWWLSFMQVSSVSNRTSTSVV